MWMLLVLCKVGCRTCIGLCSLSKMIPCFYRWFKNIMHFNKCFLAYLPILYLQQIHFCLRFFLVLYPKYSYFSAQQEPLLYAAKSPDTRLRFSISAIYFLLLCCKFIPTIQYFMNHFIKIFFSAVEMFNFRMRLFICQKNLIINTSKMCSSCSALQRGGQQFLYKYFLLSKNMLGNGENAYLSPDVYQGEKLPGLGNSLYI